MIDLRPTHTAELRVLLPLLKTLEVIEWQARDVGLGPYRRGYSLDAADASFGLIWNRAFCLCGSPKQARVHVVRLRLLSSRPGQAALTQVFH